jgi:hypothetical protein
MLSNFFLDAKDELGRRQDVKVNDNYTFDFFCFSNALLKSMMNGFSFLAPKTICKSRF